MITNKVYYYGIKYRVVKFDDDRALLFPVSLQGGLSDNIGFSTDHCEYPILRNKNSFTNKYVVSNVYYTSDLEKKYDYYEDTNLLGKYFFEENRECVLYVETLPSGELKVSKIDLSKYKINRITNDNAIYYYEQDEPSVKLNESICNKLLQCDSLEEIKRILLTYKITLEQFKSMNDDGITRIDTVNNKIKSIDINRKAEEGDFSNLVDIKKDTNIERSVDNNYDITKEGLYNAIHEKILGHDEEIKIITRRLYRNYIAGPNKKIKSILITGPSGTGKTETIKAAAEYLHLPYVYINAANLVPSGIVGPKIEDSLIELYYKSGKNKEKAQRGIVFIDEYDKIGDLDVKTSVKPILLSFNGGEKFSIPELGKGFIFDTSRLNRVYGGVFEKLENKIRKMGFGIEEEKKEKLTGPMIKREIIKNGYYTKEDLGRISTFVRFEQLDLNTKKDILLHSKLSDLKDTINGYKDDFGVEVIVEDDFLNALLESIPEDEGMRDIAGYLDEILDEVEEELCDHKKNTYKKLVLSKKIIENHKNYDLS